MLRPRTASALALVTLAAAVAACGSSSGAQRDAGTPGMPIPPASIVPVTDEPPEPVLPVTVRSADGHDVTVTDAARVVPLWGGIAEVVFALGLGDRVVGRDVSATFEGTEDLPFVTRAHDVSAEGVLSLEPTVVLAQTDTGPPEALEQIRRAGVPVVVLEEPTGLDDVIPRIRAVAEVLGVPDAGAALAARTQAELDTVAATIPEIEAPPRVAFLYMRGQAGVYLIGGDGSGADSMIEAAGGVDAGSEMGLDAFTPITPEALVTAAPEVILMLTSSLDSVGGIDGLVEIPGIAQTPAGRDRRVITIDDALLYSFGARAAEALGELVEALYRGGRA